MSNRATRVTHPTAHPWLSRDSRTTPRYGRHHTPDTTPDTPADTSQMPAPPGPTLPELRLADRWCGRLLPMDTRRHRRLRLQDSLQQKTPSPNPSPPTPHQPDNADSPQQLNPRALLQNKTDRAQPPTGVQPHAPNHSAAYRLLPKWDLLLPAPHRPAARSTRSHEYQSTA